MQVIITTYEGDSTTPTLSHTFYGNDLEEINGIIQSHRITDMFFDSSFKGRFFWRGNFMKLRNEVSVT